MSKSGIQNFVYEATIVPGGAFRLVNFPPTLIEIVDGAQFSFKIQLISPDDPDLAPPHEQSLAIAFGGIEAVNLEVFLGKSFTTF